MNSSCTLFADRVYVWVQIAATVERTWQRFSHFECASSLCIVIRDALIAS